MELNNTEFIGIVVGLSVLFTLIVLSLIVYIIDYSNSTKLTKKFKTLEHENRELKVKLNKLIEETK